MLAPLQGEQPGSFLLLAIWGVFVLAIGATLYHVGWHWKGLLLAFFVGDWSAGIIANSSEPVRAWWRERLLLRKLFYVIHLLEIPLIFWLAPGPFAFQVMLLLLMLKLLVFALGRDAIAIRASVDN